MIFYTEIGSGPNQTEIGSGPNQTGKKLVLEQLQLPVYLSHLHP
jgi:hypothetical protein